MDTFWPSVTMNRHNEAMNHHNATGKLKMYISIPFRPDRARLHGTEWAAQKIVDEACRHFDCRPRDLYVFNWNDGAPDAWKR